MVKKIILITLILILAGCQKVEEPKVAPKTAPTEAEIPSDISIESDISAIDSLDEDLDPEELENIEQELDDINW